MERGAGLVRHVEARVAVGSLLACCCWVCALLGAFGQLCWRSALLATRQNTPRHTACKKRRQSALLPHAPRRACARFGAGGGGGHGPGGRRTSYSRSSNLLARVGWHVPASPGPTAATQESRPMLMLPSHGWHLSCRPGRLDIGRPGLRRLGRWHSKGRLHHASVVHPHFA